MFNLFKKKPTEEKKLSGIDVEWHIFITNYPYCPEYLDITVHNRRFRRDVLNWCEKMAIKYKVPVEELIKKYLC